MPNRMDGEGYTELVDHPNGAAHFGAWLAIVEIASRRDDRGTLPQAGAGIPQDDAGISQALARISRLPAKVFEEVLPRLLQIGWIEQVSKIPQEGATIPQDPAVPSRDTRAVTEQERRGEDRTEQERPATAVPHVVREKLPTVREMSRQFEQWWALWSSVRGTNHRQQAENFYIRLVTSDLEEPCLQCTASYLQSLAEPSRGYNPENFLSEQSAERFTARWPCRAAPKGNGKANSLTDRTIALMQSRIAKGEKPF